MFVELTRNIAERVKIDLRDMGKSFESSECYNLIHIEISSDLTPSEINKINANIDEYIKEEGLKLKGNEFNKEAFIHEYRGDNPEHEGDYEEL